MRSTPSRSIDSSSEARTRSPEKSPVRGSGSTLVASTMWGGATGPSDRRTDPALGGAILAVAVGGIEEVDRAVERGQNGRHGPFLFDGVPVKDRHAGEGLVPKQMGVTSSPVPPSRRRN